MAVDGTPRRRNREPQYFELGVQGRKTGITLRQGERDELGVEAIDGIFSSPAKPSPARTRGSRAVAGDAVPANDPPEDDRLPSENPVRSRRPAAARVSLPPPRARSPIKTNLNSPARRPPSMAPDSPPDHSNFKSPARRLPPMTLNSSPDVDINAEHLTSQRPVKRRLDFSMETALPSVEMPPTTTKSPERKHDRPRPGVSQSPLKQVTSLNQSKARPKPGLRAVPARTKRGLVQRTRVEDLESDSSLGSVIVQQVSEAEDSLPQVNGHMDSYENPEDEYDQVRMDDDDDAHLQAQDVEDSLQELYRQAEEGSSRHYDTSISSKRKRGKPPKPAAPIAAAESVPKAAAPKKGRGKSRKPSEPVYDDIRPTKRRKENINPLDEQGPSKRPKATKAKLTRRDPNAKMASTRTRNVTEEFSDEADAPPAKPAPGKKRQEPASYESNQRSNWQAREDVPERDPRGAQITRSGRPAVKPMEYWRNERAIYSDGNSLQAIVRTEAVNPPKRARGRPRGSKNKAEPKAKTPADTVVVEEDDKEPWEEEPGIINGYVRQWDEELATGVDDVVAAEIAYASQAIETREVANTTFRYAKTLTLPFFGSGMVDLPPGGVKRPKNSRKMQMVFFVFYGKVRVDVADTSFRIGKGGMWQVPRGNFYSIANDSDKPARIFFSQGCEVAPEGEAD